MFRKKRILCLANSLKVGGSCIAGREVLPDGRYGGWIRPVSSRPTEEISFMESLCEGNRDPELLDILDIPLLDARPHKHQTENHLIDPSSPWVKQARITYDELAKACQHPTMLWMNTDRTMYGTFDCISREEAATFTKSLVLIHVDLVTLIVRTKKWDGDARQSFRASFGYKGVPYNLSVTDPATICVFGRKGDGTYTVPEAYLTISLTEPYARDNNRSHKIVAAIIAEHPF